MRLLIKIALDVEPKQGLYHVDLSRHHKQVIAKSLLVASFYDKILQLFIDLQSFTSVFWCILLCAFMVFRVFYFYAIVIIHEMVLDVISTNI